MFIYLFLRERERERERERLSGGGVKREGDTESKAGSRLWAVSTAPDVGLEPVNHKIMTWAEVGRFTSWVIQAPQTFPFLSHLDFTTSQNS